VGVSKFLKLGFPQLWSLITLSENLWLRWGFKQSCRSHQKLSTGMWHATCTQGNQGDSWLLMVGNQIGNLSPDPFLAITCVFKYANRSCETILDIYIPITFQWCKELLNPMGFDPYDCFVKIQESIGTPTHKVGAHLGMWGSFPHTLPHSKEHEMWFSSFILGSQLHKPLLWLRAQG